MFKKLPLLLTLILGIVFISQLYKSITVKKYNIFHVSSYHPDFKWDILMERGIKKAFKDNNIKYFYNVFYMDSKKHQEESFFEQKAKEAIDLIKKNNPDIIIISDDNAANFVAQKLLNTKYKMVFCGVNADPSEYGFNNALNITGIREKAPGDKAVKLIKLLNPKTKKIVSISETSDTGIIITNQIKEFSKDSKIKFDFYVTNSFEKWKEIIIQAQNDAGGVINVMYFSLKDKFGSPVYPPNVISWMIQKSQIPEIGIRRLDAELGVAGVAAADEYFQGYIAASIATEILNGKDISTIPIKQKGPDLIYINPKRVKELGLEIPKDLETHFPGDKIFIGGNMEEY